MVWLVLGLPAVAIAASLGLVYQALHAGPDDAVIDDVRRTGQMQVAESGPEQNAARRGLSVTLLFTAKDTQAVPVTGDYDRTAALKLTLAHPADNDHDQHTALQATPQGWGGDAVRNSDNDWVVRLEAEDGSWRLHGRLARGQQALLLRAAAP
jgi:hypothetical protein